MGMFHSIEPVSGTNILIYGPPKSGKTTLLGTAVEGTDEKMALIDCEGGIEPIAHLKKNIFTTNLVKTYDELMRAADEAEKAIQNGNLQWIAIDHLTEAQENLMQEVKTETIRSSTGDKKVTRDKSRYDDWGTVITRLKNVVKRYRDLSRTYRDKNLSVVFIAHKKVDKSEDGEIKPALDGIGVPEIIAGYCDVVLFTRTVPEGDDNGNVKIRYFVSTAPTGKFIAGDRFNVLEQNEEPNLRTIVQKIRNKKR